MITEVFASVGWDARHRSGRVDTQMWWDESDPLVVWVSLAGENETVWGISRELLADGSQSTAGLGEGDVRIRRIGRYGVMLHLRSPDGVLDVMLPYRITVGFLDRIQEEVPIGGEREGVAIGDMIEDFLAGLENEEECP